MDTPANPWFSWDYVQRNWDEVAETLVIHIQLTLLAVVIAVVIALPLAILARRIPRLAGPIMGTTGFLYTIPSFALFALLAPYTGIGSLTVLIGLVMYALLILVRNILVGLEGVDPDVVDAARGLGYGETKLLFSVELPNALPSMFAGLRLATVSTVSLVTVGVVVGYGGLGQLMFRGLQSDYHAQIATSALLCLALALILDVLLLLAGKRHAMEQDPRCAFLGQGTKWSGGCAMSTIQDAWEYLTTPENWTGANGLTTPTFDGGWTWANDSIIALTIEHLFMSFAAVTIAAVIALPLGIYLGHSRKGGAATVVVSNVSRAMPTLALLTLFAASAIGFGNRAVIIAVAIFAFPPILTNAFTGMSDVDADVRDSAKGLGMTGFQVATRVELPLAVPLIAAGMRTSSTQSVATVPLAALVAGGGLGVIINTGFATQQFGEVLAGGILVTVLALSTDAILGRLQRRVTPPQLRAATTAKTKTIASPSGRA